MLTNNIIADSIVVITGASSGMGKEITYRYAERGCKIVIAARKYKDLEAVSQKIYSKDGVMCIRELKIRL
jgi:NADP-dependent 3-hydroxy acid dehydrogenase YdfG